MNNHITHQYRNNNSHHGNDVRKKIEDYSYGLSDVIGKGYSSSVFKGINQKTKQIVAIKVIDIKSLKDKVGKQMLQCEIQALRKLNHNNILKCYDVYSTMNNCYIITQFCTEGDLDNLIKKRQKLSQREACPIFKDIFKGFHYLATKGFLHRDLKPANIFIKDNVYKIADFGFAKKDNGMQKKEDYNVGTPLYMSPQALKNNIYTVKNDIWSLGIILYELLHGCTPWDCKSEKQLLQKLSRNQPINFSRNVSDDLKDFVRKCLNVEEQKRISLFQMESHPFIKRIIHTNQNFESQYQSVPQLNRLMSNNQNRQPVSTILPTNLNSVPIQGTTIQQPKVKQERRTKQQRAITSQIYFMRYLYRYCEYLSKGKFHFLVIKQLISILQALKSCIIQKMNVYNLQDWEQFVNSQKFKKYPQVIIQYSKKYSKFYTEIEQYIQKGTKDKRFSNYLNKNFQRTQAHAINSLFYALQQIKQCYKDFKQMKYNVCDNDGILSDHQQKIALKLDFSMTYYQLLCLCIDNWSDLDYFSRTSKVEIITQFKNFVLQKNHLEEIQFKLKQLQII